MVALNSATSRVGCERGGSDVLQRETAFRIWEDGLDEREDTNDALRLAELQDWAEGKTPAQLPLESILAAQYALCHKLVEQDEQIRVILASSNEECKQTQGLARRGAEGRTDVSGGTPADAVHAPATLRPVVDAITSAAATGAPFRPGASIPMGTVDPRLGPHVRAFEEAVEVPPLPRQRGMRKDGSGKEAPNLIRSSSSRWWKERTDTSACSAFSEDTVGIFSSEIEQAATAAQAGNLQRSPPAKKLEHTAVAKGNGLDRRRFAFAVEPSQESPVEFASLAAPVTDVQVPRHATVKSDEQQAIISLIRQVASNAGVGQHAAFDSPVDSSPADTEVLGEARFI